MSHQGEGHKNFEKPEIATTRDGSHTLYSHQFEQHYHNPNGAVAESRHNFFEVNGLFRRLKEPGSIRVLEVGFGTGLNLLLMLDALSQADAKATVHYYSIEAWPIDGKTARAFNFGKHISKPELNDTIVNVFNELQNGLNHFDLTPNLKVTVFQGLFKDFPLDDLRVNYIFHDAFSPDVNQELWSGETFNRLRQLSAPDVLLTTYSAASRAKGAMAWAGWKLAKVKGALGKREMTIAALDESRLKGLERVNEERLAKRYKNDDFE